jgi:ribosomal protein S18 acetylase RimI-like enzyme
VAIDQAAPIGQNVEIRPGASADAEDVARLLRLLADSLGGLEHHRSTAESIRRDGFGRSPLFSTFLAHPVGDTDLVGLCVYLADYSTTRGRAGVYILDLVVAPEWQGRGIGLELLRAAASDGQARWDAAYMILSVAQTNVAARRFYRRQGMKVDVKSDIMTLDGLQSLSGR